MSTTVASCVQELFDIPIHRYVLFLAVIFYIFLDGIYQFAVFIRECIGIAFAQYAVVRFGDTDVEGAFACFGGYVLDDCRVDFQLDDVFYLLAFLPRLLAAKMLMFVASSWAASVTFLFRFSFPRQGC